MNILDPIQTHYDQPPIPVRGFDWSATFGDFDLVSQPHSGDRSDYWPCGHRVRADRCRLEQGGSPLTGDRMSACAIEVFPAVTVGSVNDKSAVLLKTGAVAMGMSVAEARVVSQRLARAADEVEYQLAQRNQPRVYEDEGPDAREHFESQQSPSESTFR